MRSPYSIAISPPRSSIDGHDRESIANRIPIANLQISSYHISQYSSATTEALLKSSSEINLWHLYMLLKESVDTENLQLDIVWLDEEEDKQPD